MNALGKFRCIVHTIASLIDLNDSLLPGCRHKAIPKNAGTQRWLWFLCHWFWWARLYMQKFNSSSICFVYFCIVFLYFGFVLMRQAKPFNQRKSNRQILCDYRIFLEISCKPHCNKLYLPRNFNQPLVSYSIGMYLTFLFSYFTFVLLFWIYQSLDATVQTTAQIYSKVVLKFYNRLSLDIFQNVCAESALLTILA